MKKEDIIARLTAAGVEIPDGATVAQLIELAASKNVDLKETPGDQGQDSQAPFVPTFPEVKSPIDIAAEAEIASMKPAEAPKGITEEAIAEKTRVGLTRKQAIEVLTAQAEHDAALAAEEKNKGKGNKA